MLQLGLSLTVVPARSVLPSNSILCPVVLVLSCAACGQFSPAQHEDTDGDGFIPRQELTAALAADIADASKLAVLLLGLSLSVLCCLVTPNMSPC